jgi:hypothetical protein
MGNKSSRPRPVFRDPYPDRQGEINQKNSQFASLDRTITAENINANVVKAQVNQTIQTKNQYVVSTTERKKDYPIKQGVLHSTKDQVLNLNNRLVIAQDNVSNTLRNVEVTKGGQVVTTLANADASKGITDKIKDTIKQTKNIYAGMNHTNHSLMNTIKNTQNSQTTDRSRVMYQIQQTDYFSGLNAILLIIYICFLLLFAFLLYRIPTNMSMFLKIVTLILLILLPYASLIYYRYIV